MVRALVGACGGASSWCDPDLTFDLVSVTFIYNILSVSGFYLLNQKVQDFGTIGFADVGVKCHCVTFLPHSP